MNYKDKSAIGYVDGEPLEVIEIIHGIEDRIILREIDTKKIHNVKIYTNSENSYVRVFGRRVYLNSMIRL